MKKIYALLIAIIPFATYSQSISQSDLPTAGQGYIMANDTNYTGAIPAGGMSQTWNYSGLTDQYHDTTSFVDASTTPFFAAFLSSNLATYDAAGGSYTYFTTNSSGMYLDGQTDGVSAFIPSPALLYIPVPFSYGGSRNSSSRIVLDFVDSSLGTPVNYRYAFTFLNQFSGDGTGSLTIPSGTFNSVLRVKMIQTSLDTLYVEILGNYVPQVTSATQSTNYFFLQSGTQNNMLLQIEADSLGTTATASHYYYSNFPASVPSVNNNKDHTPYPNPATTEIQFKNVLDRPDIKIYDAAGKLMIYSRLNGNQPLEVKYLPSGQYFYQMDIDNHTEKGKFTIQR